MRLKRILLLAILAAAFAGVFVSDAGATAFDDQPCPPLNGPHTCVDGETGKAYSVQLKGREGTGCAPYQTFSVLSGTLPPGLKMSSSGLISGTPTQTGTYVFYVNLRDTPPSEGGIFWCTNPQQAQRDFQITIRQGLNIDQRQSILGEPIVNQAYSKQLTASGAGSSPLTWTVTTGSLPTGLSINSGTGLISGTPTQTGDWTFKVRVTDGTRQDIQTYTLSIVEALRITSAARATGLPDKPFTFQLTGAGGKTPYKWTAEGLPTGLNLDQNTGAISGTSAAPGSYTVKVTLTDALGLQQTTSVTIAIGAKLAIVRGTPLPTLKVGKKYHARLAVTGGVAPRTWKILGGRPGTLPPGITFNTRTGVFSGTPKKAGTWRLRMQVTDAAGTHDSVGIVLKVLA